MDNMSLQNLLQCAQDELDVLKSLKDVQVNLLDKFPDNKEIKSSVETALGYLQMMEVLVRLQISSLSQQKNM